MRVACAEIKPLRAMQKFQRKIVDCHEGQRYAKRLP